MICRGKSKFIGLCGSWARFGLDVQRKKGEGKKRKRRGDGYMLYWWGSRAHRLI